MFLIKKCVTALIVYHEKRMSNWINLGIIYIYNQAKTLDSPCILTIRKRKFYGKSWNSLKILPTDGAPTNQLIICKDNSHISDCSSSCKKKKNHFFYKAIDKFDLFVTMQKIRCNSNIWKHFFIFFSNFLRINKKAAFFPFCCV